ncbi:MAG TPA: T9SS type A sorting domain-containing protein [Adhaeribacter sp.]|nr:T9SS type A sorting domain-containing protein [Adhaeribacter sp.]
MKKTVLSLFVLAALGLDSMAQVTPPSSAFWTSQATGFATPSRGIRDIDITSPTNAWAITYDGSGGQALSQDFTRTVNGGTTWTPGSVASAAPGYAFSNISAVDANTAWIALYNNATGSGGRVLKTTDGGATWTQQAATAFTNSASFLNIVHMFDANNGWLQGDPANGYFEMYTTTNGGTTWTRVPQANIPAPVSGEFGTVDVYTTVGNNIIYFGTNKGRVFKSTDAGLTWTITGTTNLTRISNLAFSSPTEGLITEGSDLMRTTDGGATWTPVQYTGIMYTNDIAFVPGTGNTYVTTGAATGVSGSSYSTNGGQTWIDYDNGLQRTALDFFSPTVGFAGGFNTDATTNGIFKFNGTVATGLSNTEFSKNLNIFPNPGNGILNIQLEKTNGSPVSLTLSDALGRQVYTQKEAAPAGAFNKQLELHNLPKGVYMLQVQTGDNMSVRKIVID